MDVIYGPKFCPAMLSKNGIWNKGQRLHYNYNAVVASFVRHYIIAATNGIQNLHLKLASKNGVQKELSKNAVQKKVLTILWFFNRGQKNY